ncbi:hypothetical protein HanIR_Chr16g0815951 [Helianthus annuus]|nr:hypothetical protein HanIR_Chr16g0815951 [Helianthus annuus]
MLPPGPGEYFLGRPLFFLDGSMLNPPGRKAVSESRGRRKRKIWSFVEKILAECILRD